MECEDAMMPACQVVADNWSDTITFITPPHLLLLLATHSTTRCWTFSGRLINDPIITELTLLAFDTVNCVPSPGQPLILLNLNTHFSA